MMSEAKTTQSQQLTTPRQPASPAFSLADYLSPVTCLS